MYGGKVPVMLSRQDARRRRVDRGQVNVVPLSTSKLQNGSAWLEFVRSFSFKSARVHFTSLRLACSLSSPVASMAPLSISWRSRILHLMVSRSAQRRAMLQWEDSHSQREVYLSQVHRPVLRKGALAPSHHTTSIY